MPQRTNLYSAHVAMGAKMVDFAGWEMPIHYGSQLAEHEQVRSAAGMFDVSHMTIVDVAGPGAKAWLQRLLANDVDRLKKPGQALYSCMLNEQGGILDDLIVYAGTDGGFRVVVNAATRAKDLAWMQRQAAAFDVRIRERSDLAMIAVQGPRALELAVPALPPACRKAVSALARFEALMFEEFYIARTGYTGEDGLEIMLPATGAPEFWSELHRRGIQPCGLGARDTLRLEAGMSLYGHDMDESTTPLESGLGWTVAWEPATRDFIGRKALQEQRAQGPAQKMVGLMLDERGVLREGQTVRSEAGEGRITSGTFSPTLKNAIALARVPAAVQERCEVEIRGKRLPARIVKYPFVRNGKPLV
ncbi:MAG TPA: glycine cleavage system aminomethyltransferase GcvT [Gammaproteobacteria bacterium]|nr:glycine cleavage system aminomethyltransferase GcvT [Gammaproteobacteria bacterium]